MAQLFSEREIRAVIWFLPLAGMLVAAIIFMRPKADTEAAYHTQQEFEQPADTILLSFFDPNTANFDELRSLGLTKYQAASLLRYRAAGKVFRIPEDVALCYGITDSLYRVLVPYISIDKSYTIQPRKYRDYASQRAVRELIPVTQFRIDTVTAAYFVAIGAMSHRQAKVVIDWRNRSGFSDLDQFRACYVVDDSLASALEPYIIFSEPTRDLSRQPLELNSADSAALRAVYGIGEKTVNEIIHYRERLGGFRSVEQLSEVLGVNERNYEKIVQQIWCDSFQITKIDINFADPKQLSRHPYVEPRMLRKLLKKRQLKGGWSTAQELQNDDILNEQEAARLLPYLRFGVKSGSHQE